MDSVVDIDYYMRRGCYKNEAQNTREIYAFRGENNLWGYKNKSGNVIIKPQFEGSPYDKIAEDFKGAIVYLSGGKGIINYEGEFVIKPDINNNNIVIYKHYFILMRNFADSIVNNGFQNLKTQINKIKK